MTPSARLIGGLGPNDDSVPPSRLAAGSTGPLARRLGTASDPAAWSRTLRPTR